ncbi:alkyl hydroperoxide reductase subunit F [Aliamphritea hakodatensis]|uniref:alkyl hydroperoxide reductase subunit F n=1 Tax=Aliamphritea hakodatensis TaxID=2895352 RepID=UPI0022FD6485|nr:alkyl hydroperoxide reductase subunit F [Aliamphritea hakodatensis]
MLDANLKSQLNTYLQNIVRPIEITVATDTSPERQAKSQELLTLATEISSLSEHITLQEAIAQDRTPSMSIALTGEAPRVTFAGVPMGHEFNSLVLALLYAGGHPPKVDEALLEQIRNLPGERNFETYVSLSCQSCPETVQALNLMALLNPNIKHTMIDGALFQQEVDSKNVMAVPSIYLNGELFGQGRMTVQEVVDQLDDAAAEKQADALNAKAPYDVLIVGGGPAGASAAIYAARKGIRTGIVADRFGGQVLDTMAIENFISVSETEGPKLVANLEAHVKDYEVDIMTGQLASGLTKDTNGISVELKNGASLQSKSVIISTGARWREMNVPGEQTYRGKGVAYCPHCDGPLFKGKKVAVIGGGNSGIEAAIDLAGIVEHVTVLEFADTLRADEVLQRKARSMANIEIISSAMTTEVLGDGNRVTGLTWEDRTNGQLNQLNLAGIFVQIGLMPNTEWLGDSIALTDRGEIPVDNRGQTSVPGVFAAGDVTDSAYKQIIIAMGSGATASLGAFDHLIRSSADQELEAVA